MIVIGIDPAKDGFAWAEHAEKIVATGWTEHWQIAEFAENLRRQNVYVFCERPQVYRQVKWKGDPNDLIDVALTVGALRQKIQTEFGLKFSLIFPHDWKGSTPKIMSHRRILAKLQPDEIDLLAGKGRHQGDILDAIGIALFALQKLHSD